MSKIVPTASGNFFPGKRQPSLSQLKCSQIMLDAPSPVFLYFYNPITLEKTKLKGLGLFSHDCIDEREPISKLLIKNSFSLMGEEANTFSFESDLKLFGKRETNRLEVATPPPTLTPTQ